MILDKIKKIFFLSGIGYFLSLGLLMFLKFPIRVIAFWLYGIHGINTTISVFIMMCIQLLLISLVALPTILTFNIQCRWIIKNFLGNNLS